MEPFIGQIIMFAGNFAPRGWALCDGQLLSIPSHSALFSILGTTYGGDGVNTFGLPDLRGRMPVHPGNGPGLTPRKLGEKSGTEAVTLTTQQIPAHTHQLSGANQASDTDDPTGHTLCQGRIYLDSQQAPDAMSKGSIGVTGGGQSHDNMSPYLCINFIIALEGLYPSRS